MIWIKQIIGKLFEAVEFRHNRAPFWVMVNNYQDSHEAVMDTR